ncbi:MAG: hypothetical protein ABSB82_17470 [Terriglobia bacterium]
MDASLARVDEFFPLSRRMRAACPAVISRLSAAPRLAFLMPPSSRSGYQYCRSVLTSF